MKGPERWSRHSSEDRCTLHSLQVVPAELMPRWSLVEEFLSGATGSPSGRVRKIEGSVFNPGGESINHEPPVRYVERNFGMNSKWK